MAFNAGSAVGYLLLDTSGFEKGLATARGSLKTFQDDSSTVADKFSAMGTALTATGKTLTLGVTAPIVGIGAAAVKTAAEFESAMSMVASISGANAEEMELLTAKAEEMGATTKFTAAESAEAFKYMAMAGWEVENMLGGIEGIMSLAAASGEDLGTTSDIVTDAMTAFGLSAAETSTVLKDGLEVEVNNTTRFVDVLAKAANSSNTNVAMLGESFKYVAPVAGSLGYSIEDTAVALGLMANQGIKAGTAGATLRNIITNMAAPTDTMQVAMDALNVSLEDAEGNVLPLMDVMKQLREGFNEGSGDLKEYAERIADIDFAYEAGELSEEDYDKNLRTISESIFGVEGANRAMYASMLAGKRGMAGLLAIVGTTDEEFDRLTNNIYNASGAAETMEDIQLNNLTGQLTILKSGVEGAAIAFGNLLMPMIKDVVVGVQDLVTWLNNLTDEQKQMIITVLEIAATVGPILILVGKLSSAIGKVIGIITGAGGLGAALSALINPITLVIAAIGLLVAAWVTDFGGMREKTSDIFDAIGIIISSVMDFISSVWENNLFGIRTVAEDAWTMIENLFSNAFTIITDLFDVFAALFSGDWEGLWEAIKTLFSDIWNGVVQLLGDYLNMVVDGILGAGASLLAAAKKAFEFIAEGFSNVWENIMEWFKKAKEDPVAAILGIGQSLFDAGVSIFTSLWDGIKSVWEGITSWVSEKINWLVDKVQFWKKESDKLSGDNSEGPKYGGKITTSNDTTSDEPTSKHEPSSGGGGDTYNFYSPEPITPIVAAREMRRAKQELALGAQ